MHIPNNNSKTNTKLSTRFCKIQTSKRRYSSIHLMGFTRCIYTKHLTFLYEAKVLFKNIIFGSLHFMYTYKKNSERYISISFFTIIPLVVNNRSPERANVSCLYCLVGGNCMGNH